MTTHGAIGPKQTQSSKRRANSKSGPRVAMAIRIESRLRDRLLKDAKRNKFKSLSHATEEAIKYYLDHECITEW
jgi:hypothetical protein